MTEQHTAQEAQPKTLGLARWVQLAFVGLWVLLAFVLDRIITLVWDNFSEPSPTAVTALALVVGGGVTLAFYRNPKVSRIANEVVGELAKVTWPSREETQVSTIVVIITSLIAAVVVGVFDAAWSAITDLIYKV